MALPGNGIFVVRGETTALITAMKRGVRWSSHSYQEEELDNLVKNLQDLKVIVNKIEDLKIIDPILFVNPFLEIIRSEDTTGHVTSLALMAIHKFLSYGLLDSTHYNSPVVVDNIADAVTHAKFVGTDQSSDGVVLMKILQVLRTLTLSAEGVLLTNDSLCEIMLACFRICFETRLSELLRRTAELYLKDMVQLVFMRLPQFSEDLKFVNMKHLKMKPVVMEHTTRNRRKSKLLAKNKRNAVSSTSIEKDISESVNRVVNSSQESKIDESKNNIVDMQGSISQDDKLINLDAKCDKNIEKEAEGSGDNLITKNQEIKEGVDDQDSLKEETKDVSEKSDVKDDQMLQSRCVEINGLKEEDGVKIKVTKEEEYINRRGIRFTLQNEEESWTLHPYGIACVREMFHFLISLCNPLDKQNTDAMIHLGLSLLTVIFEIGADSIGKYDSLLILVKNNLCRNLISLLHTERISIFAVNLQVSFLMFEALRMHLKFQLEFYLTKLIDIVTSDVSNLTYEHRELALDYIVQLWKIPGFVTELYVNYDCSMYCSNLFEDLTKLLAKNAFPLATGVFNTHLLSLDALLAVIENIEIHCAQATKMKFDVHHNATTTTTVTKSNKEDITSYNNKADSLGISTTAVAVRQKKSENVPTKDNLMKIKDIKKWLPQGNEYFNHKPEKGVQFLQDHGVLENDDVVSFLRENPALDKAKIGEYISHKKNFKILEAFVKMFDFTGTRIDSALRMYLETFRLPGEAQLISRLLEHFAEHWHKCNGEPFKNADAAFTLAYAIIILNVDQHNSNVKRQNNPMTCEDFKKNLKGVNGGTDFDESMLDEIYNAIKNEEIVMPAEHTGLVKENYMWKFLLRRGLTNEGFYFHTGSTEDVFDENIFCLIWGPVMSALSFVFNKSEDANVYRRALNGFESSASISAHFGMTNNLDMLILTLSKFTLLYHNNNNNLKMSSSSSSSSSTTVSTNCAVAFGTSAKAQAAFKTMFAMVHQYGDNIRDGWKHVFSVIVTLYSIGLLPQTFLEVEDFTEPNGKIVLVCEPTVQVQKQELSGILSSLYSYMISSSSSPPTTASTSASILSGNSNNKPQQRTPQQLQAEKCVQQCNLDQLLIDSKFLHEEALLELVKALVEMSRGPDVEKFLGYVYNENLTVFFLELLLKVVTQNRDRVMTIWNIVHNHLYTLMMNASHFDYQFLLERSVIGLLRLAIRLMRNEEMSPVVVQSLRMLLLLKSTIIYKISVQISCGLYELLKTSAQNIHTSTDWSIIFTLLECVGAGAQPPKPLSEDSYHLDDEPKSEGGDGGDDNIGDDFGGNYEDEVVTTSSDKGYTTDVEVKASSRSQSPLSPFLNVTDPLTPSNTPTNPGGWILVGAEGDVQPVIGRTPPADQYSLALECNLGPHKPKALLKCCESLAFLVRDVAHITPYNFDNCIHCVRTFAEASLNGRGIRSISGREFRSRKKATGSIKSGSRGTSPSTSSSPKRDEKRERGEDDDDDEENSDDEYIPNGYHQISIQLLDLMHTLHTRTAQIFRWWAEEGGVIAQETSLWSQGWCPLLQGIARLCCDNRRQVRMSALTYLQRALLVHDLETLNGFEWEACFHRVLFPLLTLLLQPNINPKNPQFLEETRIRAATLLSKVFLHHLTPLLSLPSFTNLWLNIIDFMDKYMHADRSELLYEAIPESLKNMLLVMESANVFKEKVNAKDQLWFVTWDRISKFLPNLRHELFNEGDHKQQLKPSHLEKVAGSESEKVTETRSKSSVTMTITQHSNVEDVTRSTVVIAPDTGDNNSNNVASSLFSHLGQMVSTPIVAHQEVKKKNISNVVPSVTLPNDVSESKGDVVPSNSNLGTLRRDNGGAATPHVFPVLYTSPSDAEITSLFGNYVKNSAVVVNSDRDDLNNGKTKSDIYKNGQFTDSSGPASVNLLSNYF